MDESIYLDALNQSFQKYLDRLKDELLAYSDESVMWKVPDGIANSAGNLAVHLYGNLNHFIGAVFGNTGYVRDRPLEFSIKNKPRAEIIEEIDATKQMLNDVLPTLTREILHADYPIKFGDETPTTHKWLIQLSTHFVYHLGQINYHRRLLDAPSA